MSQVRNPPVPQNSKLTRYTGFTVTQVPGSLIHSPVPLRDFCLHRGLKTGKSERVENAVGPLSYRVDARQRTVS